LKNYLGFFQIKQKSWIEKAPGSDRKKYAVTDLI
jgi:hypothetical protein